MTTPLSREAQIDLMVTTKQRLEETAKRQTSHHHLRATMAKPAPGQPQKTKEYKSREASLESCK
jgi:hypothetical protein